MIVAAAVWALTGASFRIGFGVVEILLLAYALIQFLRIVRVVRSSPRPFPRCPGGDRRDGGEASANRATRPSTAAPCGERRSVRGPTGRLSASLRERSMGYSDPWKQH